MSPDIVLEKFLGYNLDGQRIRYVIKNQAVNEV
jgi:hypothetical protein